MEAALRWLFGKGMVDLRRVAESFAVEYRAEGACSEPRWLGGMSMLGPPLCTLPFLRPNVNVKAPHQRLHATWRHCPRCNRSVICRQVWRRTDQDAWHMLGVALNRR